MPNGAIVSLASASRTALPATQAKSPTVASSECVSESCSLVALYANEPLNTPRPAATACTIVGSSRPNSGATADPVKASAMALVPENAALPSRARRRGRPRSSPTLACESMSPRWSLIRTRTMTSEVMPAEFLARGRRSPREQASQPLCWRDAQVKRLRVCVRINPRQLAQGLMNVLGPDPDSVVVQGKAAWVH